jgi:hypothetical protein
VSALLGHVDSRTLRVTIPSLALASVGTSSPGGAESALRVRDNAENTQPLYE